MKQTRFSKCTAAFIALVLALQVTLPQAALAEQRAIGLDNHTVQTDQTTLISGIAIDGVTTVDSNQLRIGLNSLLTWMHEGSTMDSLIVALSPRKEDGTPVYKDTAAFQDLLKIVNENGMIPSTVKSDEARIGGGRTDPDKANSTAATATAAASSTTGQTEQQQTPLPAAAKTGNEPEIQAEQQESSMQAAAVTDEACDTAAAEQSALFPASAN